jgi:hypothetical protein
LSHAHPAPSSCSSNASSFPIIRPSISRMPRSRICCASPLRMPARRFAR